MQTDIKMTSFGYNEKVTSTKAENYNMIDVVLALNPQTLQF